MEDSLSEARWPRALLSPSLQAPAGQAGASVRSAPWTSGRVRGRPWHHPPSDTAGPYPSQTSWPAAGPRGALAAPRSGLRSPRDGVTVAGAPRCRGARAPACWGAPSHQAGPSPRPAPPHPQLPGLPLPVVALRMAAGVARARPGVLLVPVHCPHVAACPCRRSTWRTWAAHHARPNRADGWACPGAARNPACSPGGGAGSSAGERGTLGGRARPWTF